MNSFFFLEKLTSIWGRVYYVGKKMFQQIFNRNFMSYVHPVIHHQQKQVVNKLHPRVNCVWVAGV